MTTKEKIAVMQAYEDGKKIRFRGSEFVYEVHEQPKATFNSFSDIMRHFEGCKMVAQRGDYILVNGYDLIHHHTPDKCHYEFTDTFKKELDDLGIKY